MQIDQALPIEAATVATVLTEAAQWLAAGGRPPWSTTDTNLETVRRGTDAGSYFIARQDGEVAGVVRLDLEDPYFWPEVEAGSSLFEGFGFSLHSVIRKGERSFARYVLPVQPLGE